MQARRRKATIAVAAMIIAGGIVGIACGLDTEGSREAPVPGPDTAPPIEAAPIPRPDGGPPDGGPDADASPGCPSGVGPTMVHVPDSGFCIDATEVTNAQYDAFLAATSGGRTDAGVPDGGLPSACAALGTFARKGDPDGGATSRPVGRMSWCQAYAYCAFAGKRLCGGPTTLAPTDTKNGEWYQACSAADTLLYPYGNTHVPGTCNDTSLGTVPVGSSPQCEGGVPGVFDMSGNVQEWTATCDDAGRCATNGGAFSAGPAFTTCPWVEPIDRFFASEETGIRCCADFR